MLKVESLNLMMNLDTNLLPELVMKRMQHTNKLAHITKYHKNMHKSRLNYYKGVSKSIFDTVTNPFSVFLYIFKKIYLL